ncbi:LysE family translocator [Siphonobacter aquaeclarae]|uniref:Threonine/homoserine/homoserine lactone efflux protein n=1 Tax=Siphonobacter aquaeclarae TaxID=563176 RepID=A0A1G9RUJ4_9BACT|nr:LysE family translocator [Siphonobacter aquaeclarae]SDM26968.1 Threonine/homoserine/homoserine lactone efflux protein [Siphonobacter aquaeclarae]
MNYWEALSLGFTSGVVMCLTLGAVFFALIRNSLDFGWTSGLRISLGVIICDAIFIFVALTGTSFIPNFPYFDTLLRVGGAIFLGAMGINTIRKAHIQEPASQPKRRFFQFLKFFGIGFTLNATNPANFIIWVSVSAYVKGVLQYELNERVVYFVACLTAIFLTQVGIAFFAQRIKRFLNDGLITWINRISGMVFVGTGIYLLYRQVEIWIAGH